MTEIITTGLYSDNSLPEPRPPVDTVVEADPHAQLARIYSYQIPAYALAAATVVGSDDEVLAHIEPEATQDVTINPRSDKYLHGKFTEYESPESAELAWRIHAQGYRAMGFVKDEAITPEGFLADGIDHSRGTDTDYYLAINPAKETDMATMRIINLPVGGTYKDLPAYQVSQHRLSPEGHNTLVNIENQDIRLKEIAALSRTEQASPLAVHELFRRVIHEAQGKGEVWFFSVVSSTFTSLTKTMGEESFTVIGEDVPIDDDRVSEAVALRPALFYPDTFLDTLCRSYLNAGDREKIRLRRSLIFFTEGLEDSRLSDLVLKTKQELLAA